MKHTGMLISDAVYVLSVCKRLIFTNKSTYEFKVITCREINFIFVFFKKRNQRLQSSVLVIYTY